MLEQIVRPFETPATIGDQNYPVTTVVKSDAQVAIITWGAPGPAPAQAANTGIGFQVVGYKQWNEVSRQTQDITVTNPDDSSQSVTVRRINSIAFTNTAPAASTSNNSNVSNTAYAPTPADPSTTSPNVSQAPPSTPTTEQDTYNLDWSC